MRKLKIIKESLDELRFMDFLNSIKSYQFLKNEKKRRKKAKIQNPFDIIPIDRKGAVKGVFNGLSREEKFDLIKYTYRNNEKIRSQIIGKLEHFKPLKFYRLHSETKTAVKKNIKDWFNIKVQKKKLKSKKKEFKCLKDKGIDIENEIAIIKGKRMETFLMTKEGFSTFSDLKKEGIKKSFNPNTFYLLGNTILTKIGEDFYFYDYVKEGLENLNEPQIYYRKGKKLIIKGKNFVFLIIIPPLTSPFKQKISKISSDRYQKIKKYLKVKDIKEILEKNEISYRSDDRKRELIYRLWKVIKTKEEIKGIEKYDFLKVKILKFERFLRFLKNNTFHREKKLNVKNWEKLKKDSESIIVYYKSKINKGYLIVGKISKQSSLFKKKKLRYSVEINTPNTLETRNFKNLPKAIDYAKEIMIHDNKESKEKGEKQHLKEIKERIIEELFEVLMKKQEKTNKELTLGKKIEEEKIGDTLFNIAIRVEYDTSGRKHSYLNFKRSKSFKEYKDLLEEMSNTKHREFMNYIRDIIIEIIKLKELKCSKKKQKPQKLRKEIKEIINNYVGNLERIKEIEETNPTQKIKNLIIKKVFKEWEDKGLRFFEIRWDLGGTYIFKVGKKDSVQFDVSKPDKLIFKRFDKYIGSLIYAKEEGLEDYFKEMLNSLLDSVKLYKSIIDYYKDEGVIERLKNNKGVLDIKEKVKKEYLEAGNFWKSEKLKELGIYPKEEKEEIKLSKEEVKKKEEQEEIMDVVEELKSLTVRELKEICRTYSISGYSNKRKVEIVKLISRELSSENLKRAIEGKAPKLKEIEISKEMKEAIKERPIKNKKYLEEKLLPILTVKELKQICRDNKISGYSKYKKEELIEYIINNLEMLERIPRTIKKLEENIIKEQFNLALEKIKGNDKEKIERIEVFSEEKKIKSKFKGFSWKVESSLIIDRIDDPIIDCECRVGRMGSFCPHFWVNFIVALKKDFFELEDWKLTVIPSEIKDKIKNLELEIKKTEEVMMGEKEKDEIDIKEAFAEEGFTEIESEDIEGLFDEDEEKVKISSEKKEKEIVKVIAKDIPKIRQLVGERISIIGEKISSIEEKTSTYQEHQTTYYLLGVNNVKFKKQYSKNEYPYETDHLFVRISENKYKELSPLEKGMKGDIMKIRCNGKVHFENDKIILKRATKVNISYVMKS
jgi:hypothetical protein